MGDFNRALGGRCNFCHADPNDKSGKRSDYAADINPNKLVARSMMKLVSSINKSVDDDAKKIESDLREVSCVSCHHVPDAINTYLFIEFIK